MDTLLEHKNVLAVLEISGRASKQKNHITHFFTKFRLWIMSFYAFLVHIALNKSIILSCLTITCLYVSSSKSTKFRTKFNFCLYSKPGLWNQQRWPLLGNGFVNTSIARQQIS
jgi:hypothetical protein